MPNFADRPVFKRVGASDLENRLEVLRDGNFPERAIDRCRADDPGDTPALHQTRQFALQRDRTVLVLLGGTGCGKTTAATWAAREVGGGRPGFIRAETLERRGRYDHECASWVERRSLLVVDDLGVEYLDGKGAFASLLDGLVDDFYSNRRRLVITSNLDPAGLRARLTDRIWSRICEAATVASCGSVDLRRGGQ